MYFSPFFQTQLAIHWVFLFTKKLNINASNADKFGQRCPIRTTSFSESYQRYQTRIGSADMWPQFSEGVGFDGLLTRSGAGIATRWLIFVTTRLNKRHTYIEYITTLVVRGEVFWVSDRNQFSYQTFIRKTVSFTGIDQTNDRHETSSEWLHKREQSVLLITSLFGKR